ncbi:MAG: hypothetical protein RL377_995 [Bacteroidota bacterium]|jgi:uncharacterized protein (DUF1684 family)
MKKLSILLIATILIIESKAQDSIYIKAINQWHANRIESLKKPNGWLNLEGLFWLHKGKNVFGKANGADCHYTNAEFPDQLGSFIYEGDSVVWQSEKQSIQINKQATSIGKPYLVFDGQEKAKTMDWSHFSWVVIKREDRIGIRFRNLKAQTLLTFKGIERFKVQPSWKLKAKLVQPTQDFLMITNIIGQTTASKNAGKLIFEKEGQSYSLDVIDEGGPNLFIVFADQTSGVSTYGAGRFVEIPKPDREGNTEIDFNKAYNPPCAFTAFATCPLPPKQNRLSLKIEAGEKNYGHH